MFLPCRLQIVATQAFFPLQESKTQPRQHRPHEPLTRAILDLGFAKSGCVMERIAIIGAGLCGLRCAEVLQNAGLEVQLFDKSRGVGGRLATRRHQHWRFDHGCPSLHGDQDEWQQLIGGYPRWDTARAKGTQHLPSLGINQLAKDLGAALRVQRDCLIESIEQTGDDWLVRDQHGAEFDGFNHVVMTLPPLQALTLLARLTTPLRSHLQAVSMAPSWVMMWVAPTQLFDAAEHYPEQSFIQRISAEHSKPDRGLPDGEYAYVLEASAAWSTHHEEADKDTIEEAFTKELSRLFGNKPARLHSAVHRWRYAHTRTPMGKPFALDPTIGLSIAGDWCLGQGAGGAYRSGTALAHQLLEDSATG